MFTKLIARSRRAVMFAFLAVMPLGVTVGEQKPGDLTLGVHGGAGQVVTVMRDCDGNALSSQGHPFDEISGSVQYSREMGSGDSRWVLGMHGGQVRLTRNSQEGYVFPGDVTYDYWNPYASIEDRWIGIGLGYLGGNLPTSFDGSGDSFRMTGHLRLGSADGGHFLLAVHENQPILTGGGPWVMGAGYAPGRRVRGFTGLSAGFHEGPGIAQRLAIGLGEQVWLDFGFRLASTEGQLDGGGSVGIRYRIPTK